MRSDLKQRLYNMLKLLICLDTNSLMLLDDKGTKLKRGLDIFVKMQF